MLPGKKTEVALTVMAKTDFGQTEFDLYVCVFVCLCVCVCLCCGVGVGFTVSVSCSVSPEPPFPWTAQNFALFLPSPAAKFDLFFPLWVSSR